MKNQDIEIFKTEYLQAKMRLTGLNEHRNEKTQFTKNHFIEIYPARMPGEQLEKFLFD